MAGCERVHSTLGLGPQRGQHASIELVTGKSPLAGVKNDQVGHFPTQTKYRVHCKNEVCKGVCVTYCIKYSAHLCIRIIRYGRSCFLAFHGVQFDAET